VKLIPALKDEANLKRRIRDHLKSLGFTKASDGSLCPPDLSKETYRHLHRKHRKAKLDRSERWFKEKLEELKTYFASGAEIDPENIVAELEEIPPSKMNGEDWRGYLFRLASLTWSVPVSSGYGRRMRFLVWDRSNNKLMGIIALGDPVFNMSARDSYLGWNAKQRGKGLVNVMDAYVLGAIPPYNQLLAGKLVACLVRTKEVADAFERKYGKTKGIISGKRKHARLFVVTTTSSLGRSSLYNRLRLGETRYFESIGFTGGWGHFQINDRLFADLRNFLARKRGKFAKRAKAHQFGQGPNYRIRVVRLALESLGMNPDILRHNLRREVFLCTLAKNAAKLLTGRAVRPNVRDVVTVAEVSAAARQRWLVARAQRRPEFQNWTLEDTLRLIKGHAHPAPVPETAPAAVAANM
jgi:hypothetical protein